MSEALRPEIRRLLDALFPGARAEAVAGDASTRRFLRVVPPDGPSRIVMDYGAPFEGETDDIRLGRIFEQARLPVARVERVCPAEGCLILEDLGRRTLESTLLGLPPGETAERDRLYEEAVGLAVAIATRGTAALERSDRATSPALDPARFRFEMDFFVEHYAGGLMGLHPVPATLVSVLHELADQAAGCSRPVLCHRDYHSRNLMVRADGTLAMVDIQDARRGPLGYDLASLIYDAYVELDEPLVSRLVERYRAALPDPPDPVTFDASLTLLAAQRMIKALGTFGYQASVLGRRRYLDGVPRTLSRLSQLLPRSPRTASIARHLRATGLLAD